MTIEYREVAGHPGYRVGSDGSVWTRKIQAKGKPRGVAWDLGSEWKLLVPRPNKSGHLQVILMPGRSMRYVHHLILEAFVGIREPGQQARHFPDRNPANNEISNLSWASAGVNQRDRIAHGTSNRGKVYKRKVVA